MRVFITLALFALANAAEPVNYVRPFNSECISMSGDSSSGVSLFPEKFMVDGDVNQQPFSTTVRIHHHPSEQLHCHFTPNAITD